MKPIFKKISAAVIALAIMVTAVVFDVPGKIVAEAAATTVSNFTALKSAIASGGTITVTSDITLTETLSITKNVTIQSQGAHTIIRGASFNNTMFSVSGSGNLTLDGSSGTLTVDGGTTWSGTVDATLGRGTSSNRTTVSGGIVEITESGIVTLNTGVILQNNYSSKTGAAVKVNDNSTLNIKGAIIRNNQTGAAGVIKTHMSGTINMTSGEIYGNKASSHGGAIQIYGRGEFDTSQTGNANCNMSGGYIHNNLAGAVGGAIAVSNYSNLSLSGDARITDNATTDSQKRGGGIGFIDLDTTLTVAGNVQVTGNKCSDTANNIKIGTNSNNKIKLGTLTSSANIGITYGDTYSPFSETNSTNYSSYFFSDEINYKVIYKSNALYLETVSTSTSVTVTYNYGGATGGNSVSSKTVYSGGTYGDLPSPTKTGYIFGGWFTAASSGTQVKSSTSVTKATAHTIYARWTCTHTWDSGTVTTAATCTAAGTKTFTCTTCGQTKTEAIAATGHSYSSAWTTSTTQHWHVCSKCSAADTKTNHTWDSGTVTTAATCTAAGSKTFTCTTCDKTKTETITAKGHTEVTDAAVAATCTTAGKTEGKHCSVCNTVITAQTTVDPTGHNWSDDYQHTAQQHWKVCTVCQAEDTKSGHNWNDGEVKVEATEYAEGETLYTCDNCGQNKTEPITKLSHTHKWSDEWTFNENYHWHECTEADLHESEVHGEEIAHNWELDEVIQAATCTEVGTGKFVCDCGAEKTEDIPIDPLGHTEVTDSAVAATCTETGLTEGKHCSECDTVIVEQTVTSALGHTEVTDDAVAATCTTEGKTEGSHCSVCSAVITPQTVVPALDHTWDGGTVTTEPTEENEGLKKFTCTACGVERDETIPTLNHEHTPTHVEEVPATETTEGVKEHWHCEGCGKDFADENGTTELTDLTIPKLTHTHTLTHVPEVPATETTEGVKEHWHCDGCGKDFADENGTTELTDLTIPKLTHTHTLTHVPEVPATETTEGVKEHWHCEGCGKDFADENSTTEITDITIPATGENDPKDGSVEKDVQQGENAPKTEFSMPLEALIEAVLTPEEQELVNDGIGIKIVLTAEDGTGAPAEDKEKVETAISGLSNYKLGQYLDVNLLKIIGGSQEKITETNAPITVVFEVPEKLRGKTEYSVIRIHDGETTVLHDLDHEVNTVTIKTDKFSTYALAYRETTTPSAPSGGNRPGSIPSGSTSNNNNSSPAPSGGNSDTTSGSDPVSDENDDDLSDVDEDSDESDDDFSDVDEDSDESDDDPSDVDEDSDESDDDFSDVDKDPPAGESGSESENSDKAGDASSDEKDLYADGEDYGDHNPSTGVAVSLIPLAAVITVLMAASKRKKK